MARRRLLQALERRAPAVDARALQPREVLLHDGREVVPALPLLYPPEGAHEPVEGVVAVGHGAVAGAPLRHQPQPERPLLRRRHREHGPLHPEQLRRAAAALVDDVLRRQRLGVIRFEPLDAARPPRLLVRHRQEHDVARQRQARALQQQHRDQLGHAQPLHVERAAPPDLAVADDARERLLVPVLALHGHHVGVIEQHQRLLAAVAAQDGAQRDAVVARVERLAGDALAFEDGPEEVARQPLPPRRVGRVDAQVVLQDAQRLLEGGVPIDRRRGRRHSATPYTAAELSWRILRSTSSGSPPSSCSMKSRG